jgi:hypothetical protein
MMSLHEDVISSEDMYDRADILMTLSIICMSLAILLIRFFFNSHVTMLILSEFFCAVNSSLKSLIDLILEAESWSDRIVMMLFNDTA